MPWRASKQLRDITNLRGRIDWELELALFAVVNREPLHQERSESRSGSTSKRMEDQEALETGALIRQLSNSVEDEINYLLA